MKKNKRVYLIFYLMSIITISCAQTKLVLEQDCKNTILEGDYEKYVGKRVEDFLVNKNVSSYKKKMFIDGTPAVLRGLMLVYDKDTYLIIEVNNYSYIKNRTNVNYDWKLSEFKKEKISEIILYCKDTEIRRYSMNP